MGRERAGLDTSNKMTPDKPVSGPTIDTLIKTSMLSAVTCSELTPRIDRSNVTSRFYFVSTFSCLRRVSLSLSLLMDIHFPSSHELASLHFAHSSAQINRY